MAMAMSFPLHSGSTELLLPFHEQQSEVADALLGFFSDSSDASHLAIDSLFAYHDDPLCNPIFLPSFNQPSFSASSSMLDLPLSSDEFDLYHCQKGPRSCGDLYSNSYDLMLEAEVHYNVPMVAPAMADFRAPELMTEFNATLPTPVGAPCNGEKKKTGDWCLSAQSMVARERRKRISEKTRELGRLIPGGNRMNTAEMFRAAYKYVKLLQAQVSILGFINSTQSCKVSPLAEERLQVLLKSAMTQEKLCNEERCLIPKEAVEAMAKDKDIRSNPLVTRDLDRFVESMNLSSS